MSSETTLPLDWLPLREAAEAAAGEWEHARARVQGLDHVHDPFPSDIDAQARLLANLRRSASRDFWARWWYENTPWRIPNIERRRLADSYREDAAALRLALLSVRP